MLATIIAIHILCTVFNDHLHFECLINFLYKINYIMHEQYLLWYTVQIHNIVMLPSYVKHSISSASIS